MNTILYKHIGFSSTDQQVSCRLFFTSFRARPSAFYAKYVRDLHLVKIDASSKDITDLIETCTNLTSLTCWAPDVILGTCLLNLIPSGTIQKLSLQIEDLINFTTSTVLRFTPQCFPNLTHLEIYDPPGRYSPSHDRIDWESILELPVLTHLAMSKMIGWLHTEFFLPLFDKILKVHPRLQLLLVISQDSEFRTDFRQSTIREDPRVVYPNFFNWLRRPDYWKRIQSGELDIWEWADAIVKDQVAARVIQ